MGRALGVATVARWKCGNECFEVAKMHKLVVSVPVIVDNIERHPVNHLYPSGRLHFALENHHDQENFSAC